jgi:hypothetical protein
MGVLVGRDPVDVVEHIPAPDAHVVLPAAAQLRDLL